MWINEFSKSECLDAWTCYWCDVIFIWKESRGKRCSLWVPLQRACENLFWKSRSQSAKYTPMWDRSALWDVWLPDTLSEGRGKERKKFREITWSQGLYSHTQGLSGDGVDPAVMTSWVILETTRSAISCLSSSMCSPIRGIELSITCHRRQKQQLVGWFPAGRCLFQLMSYIDLFCVSTSLLIPIVTTLLMLKHAWLFLVWETYFPQLSIFLPFTTWEPSQDLGWLEAF